MSQFLRPLQVAGNHSKLGDEVIEYSRGLVEYFDSNRIYFDEDFCIKMDVFATQIRAAWSDGRLIWDAQESSDPIPMC